MELESLTLLIAVPIHEEPVRGMDHNDRAEHDDTDAQGGDAAQETDDQCDGAEELTDD